MTQPTRRSFLRAASLGPGVFSIGGGRGLAAQVGTRSLSEGVSGQPPKPADMMAIAAHPGDAFFTMAAPVALQIHLGGQGVFLSLSLGEKGSASIPPTQYGELQRQASERAAEKLGAKAEFLAYPDGEIPAHDEVKLAVCDLIRTYRPDVIVTHWRGSWHKDHRACYEIVNDAVFYAALPAIQRARSPHSVRRTFFADNWEDADGFRPDTYLEITPVFERWAEVCAFFPMWHGETGFRYDDYYRSLARSRGCLSGFEYAVALMSPPDELARRARSL